MQIFAWSDYVVSSAVASHYPTLPLQGAFYKCPRTLVTLIGELYLVDSSCWSTGVDENITASLYESVPLEIKWEALGGSFRGPLGLCYRP